MFRTMREGRYPLAAARTQRKVALEQAEQALREARAQLQVNEAAVEAARTLCAAHAQRRTLLVSSSAHSSAAQLAFSGAYAARLQREAAHLAEQLQAALCTLSGQARAVRLAELAWQRAYAEREAIDRHHERFRVAERKAAERADELELEERVYKYPTHARS